MDRILGNDHKTLENLKDLFSIHTWRQRITLDKHYITPGYSFEKEWEIIGLPNNLDGLTFLDVGANDGMYSFLAEKKGAKKVLATDLYINEGECLNMTEGWDIRKITLIRKYKNSLIDIVPVSIYQLVDKLREKFDVVFCGNVLAWLDDPLMGLEQLCLSTKKMLIIREDISNINKPVLEKVRQNGNKFNWIGSKKFYIDYFQSMGFTKVEFRIIDEWPIFLERKTYFPHFELKDNINVFNHPFSDNQIIKKVNNHRVLPSLLNVNGFLYFNELGWIKEDEVKKVDSSIPKNYIKRKIFEWKFRKNSLQNCVIYAYK